MTKNQINRIYILLAGIILCGGFALRVFGIDFGLPAYAYHTDESLYGNLIINYLNGAHDGLASRIDMYSPFYWLMMIPFTLIRLLSKSSDPGNSIMDSILIGRIIVAVFSAGTVAAIIYLGKILFNRWVGLLAGLVLSVTFIDIQVAHYFKHDALVAFFGLWAVVFSYLALKNKKKSIGFHVVSIFFIALAGVTKIYGFFFVLPLLVSIYYRIFSGHALSLNRRMKRLLITLFVSVFFFSIILLYLNISKDATLPLSVIFKDTIYYLFHPVQKNLLSQNTDGIANWIWWPSYIATTGLGWVLTVFSTAGFILLLTRINKKILFLMSFPVVYLGILMLQSARFDRWLVLATPFLAIFSACFIYWVMKQAKKRNKYCFAVISIVLIFLLALPLCRILIFDAAIASPDNRQLAAEWVISNKSELPPIVFTYGAPAVHEQVRLDEELSTIAISEWDNPALVLAFAGHRLIVNDFLRTSSVNYNNYEFSQKNLQALADIDENTQIEKIFENKYFAREYFGPKKLEHGATANKYHQPKISVLIIPELGLDKRASYVKRIPQIDPKTDRYNSAYKNIDNGVSVDLGYLPGKDTDIVIEFEPDFEPKAYKVEVCENITGRIIYEETVKLSAPVWQLSKPVVIPEAKSFYLKIIGPDIVMDDINSVSVEEVSSTN